MRVPANSHLVLLRGQMLCSDLIKERALLFWGQQHDIKFQQLPHVATRALPPDCVSCFCTCRIVVETNWMWWKKAWKSYATFVKRKIRLWCYIFPVFVFGTMFLLNSLTILEICIILFFFNYFWIIFLFRLDNYYSRKRSSLLLYIRMSK